MTKSTLKKIGWFFGILLTLFVLTAVIVPLVVDVDTYRPRIVEEVNRRIHGNLELGQLRLSLWGKVKIEVGGLKLNDAQNSEVMSAKDVDFEIPFLSLLT